jgi:hypothetical protein
MVTARILGSGLMPWNDDSWREPDYGDEPEDECPHDDYEVDWDPDYDDETESECQHDDYEVDWGLLRATCSTCGHAWWMCHAEVQSEVDHIRAHDEWCRKQQRPWNRFKAWLSDTRLVTWVRSRWWAWRYRRTEMADAINDTTPF